MPPALPDDSAPFAPLASLEAKSRPQQPQATAQWLGGQRNRMECGWRGVSKCALATLNQQATQQLALAAVKAADAEHIPAGRLTRVRDGLEGVRLKLEDTPQAERSARPL